MEMDRKDVIKRVEGQYKELLEEICHYIFEHPELGGAEWESSAYLVKTMREQGFQVTCPYAGEETGFRAELGQGDGPVIAFLAEYDALPGYREDGGPGHACGHNWIAAAMAGAAMVAGKLMGELPGRILLIGTPAEESYGGKVTMIEHGGFKDVDVAMQAHLDASTETAAGALAVTSTRFQFQGKAAHAAQFPHEGINALDAVQLTFAGMNAMRQHVTPDVRIHGIVTDGGAAANIIPETSACHFMVRAKKRDGAKAVTEKLFNCVKGASLMTGAQWSVVGKQNFFYDLINIPALVGLADRKLTEYGFTKVHRDVEAGAGSSDIGNLSYACPTMYMEVSVDDHTTLQVHDRSALDLVDSEAAYKRLHQVVCAMAAMALELLENPSLVEQARQEHQRLTGDTEGR